MTITVTTEGSKYDLANVLRERQAERQHSLDLSARTGHPLPRYRQERLRGEIEGLELAIRAIERHTFIDEDRAARDLRQFGPNPEDYPDERAEQAAEDAS